MNLKRQFQFSVFNFAPLLAAVLLLSIFNVLPVRAETFSTGVNFSYIVQLNSNDVSLLSKVATNVKPEFVFSESTEFANIFTFQSSLTKEQLQQTLTSHIQSLDYDTAVSTGVETLQKTPNDPGFTKTSSNTDKEWGLAKAGFISAWKKTIGSPDVIVAVIDTGVDETHEDFEDTHFTQGYDVIAGTLLKVGRNSDDNGHGTLVSGIIAASTNNKVGIAGASPGVTIMPVKTLNSRGSGLVSNIASAIVWAVDNNADVINLSLGGLSIAHNDILAKAVSYAFEKDVVIVAAAGNDVAITGGNLDDNPVFPVCNDNDKNMVIGVTASDSNDLKPAFANFGRACVDVVAPGKRILSLINHDPSTGFYSPDSYAYASGTSMSAPFVSSQAALLRSLYPQATNGQVRDRILGTATSIDRLNITQCAGFPCVGTLGSGRIEVSKSLGNTQTTILDGDVVEVRSNNSWYLINGGRRQFITSFVKSQRFTQIRPKKVNLSDLDLFPESSYAAPQDGTLVKSTADSAVYYISGGVRLPVSARVFALRQLKFSDVVALDPVEINSWVLGSWLTPPEGTLIKAAGNPTVYWVSGYSLHPISYDYYLNHGLQIFSILTISQSELNNFPVGEAY